MERTFDYIPRFDERSLEYPVEKVEVKTAHNRKWWAKGVLDQGSEGACVGHGIVGALLANPVRSRLVYQQQAAFGVYQLAQYLDQWAGENYEGTSVLAGCKVVHKMGLIQGYRWCFGIDDVIETVLEHGPVVIGVPWLESMHRPRPSGFLDVSGRNVGGHCVFLHGFFQSHHYIPDGETLKPYFVFRNSWGVNWGKQGDGAIYAEDLEKLLANRQGEAVFLVR